MDAIKYKELLAVAQASLRQSSRNVKEESTRLGARILSTESWEQFYDQVKTKKNSYTIPFYVLIHPAVMKLMYYNLRDMDLIEPTASASDVIAEIIVAYFTLVTEGRIQNENNRQIDTPSGTDLPTESMVEQVLPDNDRRDTVSEEVNPDGSGISGS